MTDVHVHIAALVALRDKVSEECLNDDGRYFLETYNDLTQCHHGETGNYNNRADGKAIAILWNLWKAGVIAPAWQPIDTAPKDGREVLIACPLADLFNQYVVSAAYFDAAAYGGTWWWAGTKMDEWGDSPVEDINEAPVFWQPMPAAPVGSPIKSSGGDA
ncbi:MULTISPECIES: hypothetical protein [unclassified Shinella]|uniref:hypothetical protein n=1 Tax=unclassified Shinella TaxID=2643062 RepID=UPI00225CE5CA|nr:MULTISPECIES: hypothetical protein [unclassified Shinella]MCO5139020.1 hypothetical protein [Shinella sp.]MDC7256251.1 hypothetical protein [Shinella sp. YE25]CAI0339108.1 hypothetical protein SHINE37_42962 [Rhizobiaceae bacterium]CAK7257523.1 protein of unknown function [Shinella sp. WSC3-e]